jgi:DNA gyrase/topoisomerase IV subunit A
MGLADVFMGLRRLYEERVQHQVFKLLMTIDELNEMFANDTTDYVALDEQMSAETRAYNLERVSQMSPEDQAAAMQRILEEDPNWLNWVRF